MNTLSKINKGGFTLPSVELINILQDPPKSIVTRKIERVEAGDITHNIRSDQDRLASYINYYARGVNPMVSTSYQNTQGGTQASLPYKVMKQGAFRPPMYSIKDRLPLSRMKYENYIGHTNPSTSLVYDSEGKEGHLNLKKYIQENGISGVIAPSVKITGGKPDDGTMSFTDLQSNTSKYINDKNLLTHLGPTFSVIVYNGANNGIEYIMNIPMKEKLKIAQQVNAGLPVSLNVVDSFTNVPIKLKDYRWKF